MKTNVRLRLGMARRAVGFVRAHPDTNPGANQVTQRLVELVDRAEALGQQQRTSQVTISAAIGDKTEIRVAMENDLAALVGIAKVAAKEHPDLTVHRRLPRPGTSESTFLTTVRVATAEARAAGERLAPFGLTDDLLGALNAGVTEYEAALDRQQEALAAQVGASAELDGVTSAIMDVVRNLDALHRVRFQKDGEAMATWKSARNVAWRTATPTPERDVTPAPVPGPGKAA